MNRKTSVILLLLALVILAGTPESFARPQYLSNLTAVYGGGSCGTCHVIAPGSVPRDSNGTFDQHNGTFEPRSSNRTMRQRNSSGQRSSNRTFPLNSYGTLFKNQPGHDTDPGAALLAIGAPAASTAVPETGAQAAPGFGIVVSLLGLFVCALLARPHNK